MIEPVLTPAGDKIATIKAQPLARFSVLMTIVLPVIGILWVVLGFSVLIFIVWAALCIVLVMPAYRAVITALPEIPSPGYRAGNLRVLAAPVVEGPPQVGGVLVSSPGQWQGTQDVYFQWQVSTPDGFHNIDEATHHWLYLDDELLGKMIQVAVYGDIEHNHGISSLPVGPVKDTDAETVRHQIKADEIEDLAPALYPPKALFRIAVITAIVLIVDAVAHHYDFTGLLN